MKKTIILVMLVTLLLGVMPATVSAGVNTMTWIDPHFDWIGKNKVAHVNADISKFEGVLHAYSVNQRNPTVEKQIFAALDDLSVSLESFNVALGEIYPSLTEEQQLAVVNGYSSLGSHLQTLAVEANSVFGREVINFIIIRECGIDRVQTWYDLESLRK